MQLAVGLTLYGASMAMIVRSSLGLDPWDVLHYGLAARTGLSFGTVVILVGVVVLALWVPIRQLPGLGTVANVVVIGVVSDLVLGVLSTPDQPAARAGLLVGGVVLNGLAGALYIGSQLGPGPRDGLMTGLVRRSGAVGAAGADLDRGRRRGGDQRVEPVERVFQLLEPRSR